MSDQIKEPFVKCTGCGKTVPGKLAIRSRKDFVLVDPQGIETHMGPQTLCADCLERLTN